MQDTFHFSKEIFNNCFPFYVQLDKNLSIVGYGKSLQKLIPTLKKGQLFNDNFTVIRPNTTALSLFFIKQNTTQLFIIESKIDRGLKLRGQLEPFNDHFIFLGSPWIMSLEEVKERKLSFSDFAKYDPLLDLLQVLKKQEISTAELKELLQVNIEQKETLLKDKVELNRLSLVASANKEAIIFTDPDAKIFWCNEAYLKITGFCEEEVMGKTPIEVGISSKTEKHALHELVRLYSKAKPFDIEIIHRKKDNSYFWSKTKGQPIFNSSGNLVQYFTMIEDMTEVKKREEQLVLLSLIAEENRSSVIICDKKGRTQWVNSSFEEMSGYLAKEIIGLKPGEYLQGPETDANTALYLSLKIKNGEPFDCEIINYNKLGQQYWVNIQGHALHDELGEVVQYFAIQENITEKKAFEKEKEKLLNILEESNKELADYAQVVSHDLKSPLRSINALIAWIREDNKDKLSDQSESYFTMIEQKLEKMDYLIQGILTYSKIQKFEEEKKLVNTNEIVRTLLSILHIPSHIKVINTDRLPIIKGNPFRIQQLFQNILSNAINCIDKEKGVIEIKVKEESNFYVFSIKDNGSGIEKTNQKKIFNSFYSLSNTEASNGLGLAIVQKIVQSYGGKIWLVSELKKGTTFYIQLYK